MKASISVCKMGDQVRPRFSMGNHRMPLLPGEHLLFSVEHEDVNEFRLMEGLKSKARAEASRRGIEVEIS
jgi:hypothetical protein